MTSLSRASEFEGRPVEVKLNKAQRAALEKAAKREGVSLSAWLRTVALLAAGEPGLCDRNPRLKHRQGDYEELPGPYRGRP